MKLPVIQAYPAEKLASGSFPRVRGTPVPLPPYAPPEMDAEYLVKMLGLEMSDIPDCDLQMLQRHKTRELAKTAVRFRKNMPYIGEGG
ncbi:MAG TPA: hypothetical protein ENI68_00425 [Gammaproteobacteria bacterium]|nr:hypothetical protein [Gammaproteobacteria bacterium]